MAFSFLLSQPGRRLALIPFLIILAGAAFPVFPGPADNAGTDRITAVSISGLKRTRPHVAEKPLLRFIGQEAAAVEPDHVKAIIIDTGILEPVSVEIRDDVKGRGKTLAVEVREKWAIFPIPVFFIGSGEMFAGAAFYDANAFGLNHKMAAAGMYQANGWIGTLLYAVSPGGVRGFGWNASFLYAQAERRNSSQKDETLRRFNTRAISAGAALQYQFSETLSGFFRLSYMNTMLMDTDEPVLPPSSGIQLIRMEPVFSVRNSRWDGYLLSEESASLGYHFARDIAGPSFHSLSFRGVYEKSIIPGFRAVIRNGLLYKPDAPVLLESGPGEAEVQILPRSFSARHYAGLSLGLEKYLFRFSFGTISLLGSWQMDYSEGPLLANQFDYGVNGALFFYMSKLAIPAVGFGAAYNIDKNYFQFSFSIGMSL
jgi:hypothetical protein